MTDLNPSNYWPLGSTVQETTSLSDTSYYRHFGIISVNPVNGHVVILYRRGDTHAADDGDIYIRHSSNGGKNWDNEIELFSETGVDLRNLAGGYVCSGRLFLFYARYDYDALPPNPKWLTMNCSYSDNDGSTWSIPQTLPLMSQEAFSPYGRLVDIGNDTHFLTWYAVTGTTYKLYLYKTTNGNANPPTFSVIEIYTGTEQYTEPSMVNLGGGCFLLLARINNQANKFMQIKSENNCVSWGVPQGITGFESLGSAASPPFLSYLNYEGVGIVACYYTVRDSNPPQLKVVYGLAKNFLDDNIGVNGWIPATIKIINDAYTGGTNVSGYQSIFLPLNQYKGIGVCFKEIFVGSDRKAYPVIIFTNINDMHGVLTALGL